MKGNTSKTCYVGFFAYWSRSMNSASAQLPTGKNKIYAMRKFQRKLNASGGVPRGNAFRKAHSLGYRSEPFKDRIRSCQ